MESLDVFFSSDPNNPVLVGQIYQSKKQIYFEYHNEWLTTGFSLSPYLLPLTASAQQDKTGLWPGLHGIFNDSLPDGWGLMLMDRAFHRIGIEKHTITPLDRLSWVGNRTMGALTYEPTTNLNNKSLLLNLNQLATHAEKIYAGSADEILPELLRVGGSPGGAKPKALIATKGDRVISGDISLPEGFTPWLVKFNAKEDFLDAGNIEYAYSLMAKDMDILMPETCLMENQYFATQRFDRSNNTRTHVHTFGNMVGADFRLPNIDYIDLLKVVFDVTKSRLELMKAFRQMVFNIATHNRDDHSKNFAFIWDTTDNAWRLSPAYDLMFSHGIQGEHTMTVAGEGKSPNRQHINQIAKKFNVEKEVDDILEKTNKILGQWDDYAEQAGISKKSKNYLKTFITSN
jgi:serine/threonine-protein kinase HipA